jgi:hypothetical protein
MDKPSFVVRHANTGRPADDLVVEIEEAQTQLAVNDLADARIAASANAATVAAQADAGRAAATSAHIADKTDAINTTGKFKGKMVYDTDSDLIYFALGATDTAKWRLTGAVDTTGDVTPS